jgi:hypothetical protein
MVPTRQQLSNHGVWYKRHLVPVNTLENCNPGDWDLIVTDADMALFPNRLYRLAHFKRENPDGRLYATYDPNRRRTRSELLLLDSIFGHDLARLGLPQTSIVVKWVDPGNVTMHEDANPVQRTVQGYWRAQERLLAMKLQLDRELNSGEVQKLAAPQESTHDSSDGRETAHQPDGTIQAYRVVILVDTPEHGRAVQTVWPDCPLETMCDTSSFTVSPSPRVIATVSAADSGLIPPGDVVVLAGRSRPRKYFGILESHASTRSAPVQLIIPADRFDDMAIQESQARYRQLAERRWRQHAAPTWLQKSE